MTDLFIEMSSKAPKVHFHSDGTLELAGRSLMEDSVAFYQPVKEWLADYAQNPQPKTQVNLAIEYFNTNASKQIMDLFNRLERIHQSGDSELQVQWFFESNDVDMQETGEDFAQYFELPIQTVPVPKFTLFRELEPA